MAPASSSASSLWWRSCALGGTCSGTTANWYVYQVCATCVYACVCVWCVCYVCVCVCVFGVCVCMCMRVCVTVCVWLVCMCYCMCICVVKLHECVHVHVP